MEILKRLRFHIHTYFSTLPDKIFGTERWERELAEAAASEPTPQEKAVLEELLNELETDEPEVDPRRTMLFIARPGERGCNIVTAPAFKKKIIGAAVWAKVQGVDTFIVEYTSPFGLLALETLLELREAGEVFHLYIFMGDHIANRKSWRLIPETPAELAFLAVRADYQYSLPPDVASMHIIPRIELHCTESAVWRSREKITQHNLHGFSEKLD